MLKLNFYLFLRSKKWEFDRIVSFWSSISPRNGPYQLPLVVVKRALNEKEEKDHYLSHLRVIQDKKLKCVKRPKHRNNKKVKFLSLIPNLFNLLHHEIERDAIRSLALQLNLLHVLQKIAIPLQSWGYSQAWKWSILFLIQMDRECTPTFPFFSLFSLVDHSLLP